ncbi:MAG: class I SAM-dependent methyltransferase [Actinobacteria bacterium]|nr:MAG: class I SAM-dependent methyltransferase [Actinomycetota bacterium]
MLLPPSGDGLEARPRAHARAAVRRRHLVVVSDVHDVAVEGFTKGTDAYERARPSYPPAAVDFVVRELGIGPASTVVDLAAGTGKLTRLLVPTGATIIAVEPVEAMRAKLVEVVPGVEVRDGTAEALPLGDASVDCVTVAQAFHWFRARDALGEIDRVLRPGGGLALIWNSRDVSVPWVTRLNQVIRWNRGQIPAYDSGAEDWAALVADAGGFTPLQFTSFRHEQEMDLPLLLDRVSSTSYIAALADDDRARLLDDVRALVSEAGLAEHFALPHRTDLYWCTKQA